MESLHDLDADTAFVGVDVGGTSTVVQAVRGSVVRVIDGPGANLQRSGRASCAAAVIMLSAQALRSLHGVDRVRMVAGVSGAGRLEEQIGVAAEIEEGLHALHVARAISVTVVHDAEIALEAAFGGSSGAIMIAGTGSVVYGRRADGSTIRVGGWGYLLGDEGSGYRLGKLALGAICRAYEGGEDTTLTDSIASAFGHGGARRGDCTRSGVRRELRRHHDRRHRLCGLRPARGRQYHPSWRLGLFVGG